MSMLSKLVISLLIGAVGAATAGFLQGTGQAPLLYLLFGAATVATALLVSLPAGKQPGAKAPTRAPAGAASTGGGSTAGDREEGEVKWFNANKGFGFIVRDNGEEIFVHFRSIRGDGRRSLRDGQRVSFQVAETDKGPQAEEVDSIED